MDDANYKEAKTFSILMNVLTRLLKWLENHGVANIARVSIDVCWSPCLTF